jgi:hypothetical protein
MTKPTGRPKGRPKKLQNNKTLERAARVESFADFIHANVPDAFQGDAHSLLQLIYKDPKFPWDLRLDAARTAVGYEKPKLAAHIVKDAGSPVLQTVSEFLKTIDGKAREIR